MLAMEQGAAQLSPEELVNRIYTGEHSAEQELVSKYWRSLYFILNRQSNDPELAADITQEAFIVVINKARLGQIENPAALSAFIRQVGVNLLIAYFRKETRRKTDTVEDIQVQFPDTSSDLYKRLSSEELTIIVKQVMDELPTARDSDLLYRYFVYGQPKDQICQEFDLSTAHFDRVLYRARNRLKQILQIKLGADSEKVNLSSLLSLIVFLGFSSTHSDLMLSDIDKFNNLVRGISSHQHLANITVMERPSKELEIELYQHNTRWT